MKALAAVFLFVLPACALFGPCPVDGPAERLADTIHEAAQDGTFDSADFKLICRDAGFLEVALEEKSKPWVPPTFGIPWLDMALGAAGVATTIFGAHKTVNWSRDRQRKQRGEPVGTKTA